MRGKSKNILRTAILISGNGTTAEAVIKACQNNTLTGIEPFVISSNPNAKGNERVKELGIEPHILDKNSFSSTKEFADVLYELIEKLDPDLISLQGWLHLIPVEIVQKFRNRIVNQHPGPIDPGREGFGGVGMSTPYRVNCALLAYVWMSGEKLAAESDTHFVTEEFDQGDLIRIQEMPIPLKKNLVTIKELRENREELIQTTHEVQRKFYPVEHENVIATLQLFTDGKAKPIKRDKPLIRDDKIPLLLEAKNLAMELFPKYNL